tara:strand:+ start:41017 stop:41361 length:345 start_codon:yes stop_codon:yes gene_type:complete
MFNANSVRLRACRKRGGLDQAELSQLIGTSYSTVSRFERGESLPDIRHLIAYEIIFDIPVSKMLPDTSVAVRNQTRERAARVLKRCRRSSDDRRRAIKVEFMEGLCRRLDGIKS